MPGLPVASGVPHRAAALRRGPGHTPVKGLEDCPTMPGAPSSGLAELTDEEAPRRLASQSPNLLPTTPPPTLGGLVLRTGRNSRQLRVDIRAGGATHENCQSTAVTFFATPEE